MLTLTIIVVLFFIWTFYKNQLCMIRYGPNIERVEDLNGKPKVYLRSMMKDDNRKSAYYYTMAAKYYALVGDMLYQQEQDEISDTISSSSEEDNVPESIENQEPELPIKQNQENQTQVTEQQEPSNDEIEDVIKLMRNNKTNKILDSLNEVKNDTLKDLFTLVENKDSLQPNKLQETFSKIAEDMLGTKIDNISDIIPPNAFEDAIKTLQSLSETFKK